MAINFFQEDEGRAGPARYGTRYLLISPNDPTLGSGIHSGRNVPSSLCPLYLACSRARKYRIRDTPRLTSIITRQTGSLEAHRKSPGVQLRRQDDSPRDTLSIQARTSRCARAFGISMLRAVKCLVLRRIRGIPSCRNYLPTIDPLGGLNRDQ